MNRLAKVVLSAVLLSCADAVIAGPFDPPAPQIAAPSSASNTDQQNLPPMPSMLDKLGFVGKINNIEVYYHEQTHCYIHVKDGVIEHDACYDAVSHWLLNAANGQSTTIAGKVGQIVH